MAYRKYSEIVRQLKGICGTEPIDIIRNFTLEPVFSDYLLWHNRRVTVRYLDPYTCFSEPAPARTAVVLLHLPDINPSLYDTFYTLSKDKLTEEQRKIKGYLDRLTQNLQDRYKRILFFTFAPDYYDFTPKGQQSYNDFVSRVNADLRSSLKTCSNLTLIELEAIANRVGADHFFDVKGEYFVHSLFTTEACDALAEEIVRTLSGMEHPSRKCLVLDCDQVLWGGVVSEDGIERIRLARQFEGKAYRDFQREIVKLAGQGVLIALCSKNDEKDVWEVFDRHPDMFLQRKHITAWRINWNDKADNIGEIAKELNISPDSMVFADDSAYETHRVDRAFPGIETILLDPKNPHTYHRILKQSPLFRKPCLTREDKTRGAMYKAQVLREQKQRQIEDPDEYQKMLHTQTVIAQATPFSIPRIAELSRRTNQFNLSAVRYTESEIAAMIRSNDHEVWSVKASDIFGDLGMIGAYVLCQDQDRLVIKAFFLSCRALGRGFENTMLEAIRDRAAKQNKKYLAGVYTPTEKNVRFSKFYEENEVVIL
jgi:FkbH-like protein